jgi:hypothetical protein
LIQGWEGKLSSFLVNFGKTSRSIKEGEVFIRLTFYNLTEQGESRFKDSKFKRNVSDDDAYLLDKKKNTLDKLGPEFLNVKAIAREVFGANLYKDSLCGWRSSIALDYLHFFVKFWQFTYSTEISTT